MITTEIFTRSRVARFPDEFFHILGYRLVIEIRCRLDGEQAKSMAFFSLDDLDCLLKPMALIRKNCGITDILLSQT